MAQKQEQIAPIRINGTALWAFLSKPQTYNGKEIGYEITVVVSEEAKEKIKEYLLSVYIDEVKGGSLKNVKLDPKVDPMLPIKETKEGWEIKARTKHFYKDKNTGEERKKTIPVFDKYGRPLPENALVGNGSVVQVSATPRAFSANSRTYGMTLQLNAVLVTELKEYNAGRSALFYGFDIAEPEEGINGESVEF